MPDVLAHENLAEILESLEKGLHPTKQKPTAAAIQKRKAEKKAREGREGLLPV